MGTRVVAGNGRRRDRAATFLMPARRVTLALQLNNALGCRSYRLNLAALLRHPVGSRAAFSPPLTQHDPTHHPAAGARASSLDHRRLPPSNSRRISVSMSLISSSSLCASSRRRAASARRHGQPASSTIRRTGRLDTSSMPVSSSTCPALPPQPSWRMRARSWRGHFRRDGHERRRRQRGPQSGGSLRPLVARDIVWRAVFSFRARDIERGPWCLLLCAAVIRALLRARRISIVRDGGSRDQHDKGGRTYHRRSPSDRG
jgi:hypothetical protein